MSKTLIFVESFSIGDTVGALPYIDKFVQSSDDEVQVSINDWLIPFFESVYPSINFVGKMYMPVIEALYGNPVDHMYIDRKYKKYLELKT